MSVRIVVVDDHAVVREGIQALLSAIEDFDLVGDADDAASAVRAAVTLAPDVILMDIGLPERSGIDAAREITRVAPEVRVLMLTMFDDDESVFSAIRAGALGYVLKGARPEQLVRAIHAVADGEAILGPGVARTALAYLTTPRSDEPPFPALTAREREVLTLIADGLGNHAIAGRLGLSSKTVGNHISSIFAKIHVASRAEAIVRARSEGLGGGSHDR